MRKWQIGSGLTACVLIVGGAFQAASEPPLGPDDIHARGPIAIVGHGSFFDHDGNELSLTSADVLEAQRYYLERLYERASSSQKAAYDGLRQRLLGKEAPTQHEEAPLNAFLAKWLIDQVKPAKASELASISSALHSEYSRLEPEAAPLSSRLQKLLEEEHLVSAPAATGLGGAAYLDACKAAGVPVPPPWGSSQWQSQGILSEKFISSPLEAEVFTYQSTSPRGICFALPRSVGDSIKLLGIICQGELRGNACFWDNQVNDRQVPIPKGTFKPILEFAGGAELDQGDGGTCTSCHAGENAFIIHPNTALKPASSALPLMPKRWYTPMVHPDWPANPGPDTVLASFPSLRARGPAWNATPAPPRAAAGCLTSRPERSIAIKSSPRPSRGRCPRGTPGIPPSNCTGTC
jgi:hypothetical protein